MNKPRAILIAAIALAGVVIFGVTALATTGAGFMGTPQVRGTITRDVHLNADRIKFQTKGETDVVVQTVTFSPAGYSGWHTHPGFVLVVVESGAVTLQVGCSTNTYSVTQSFYESGTTPIMARNNGTSPAVVRVTYIVPKGSPVRLEANAPTC